MAIWVLGAGEYLKSLYSYIDKLIVCIRYGLLPMVLIPKLTKVYEGIVSLSLLGGS